MKNKESLITRLFRNKKFLLVFSFLLTLALWTMVKINYSEDVTITLDNVKVNLMLGDDVINNNFTAFYSEDELVVKTVTVTGKAINISKNTLKNDDIEINAVVNNVVAAGRITIPLTARLRESANVEVTSINLSAKSIEILFDSEKKQDFDVEARLNQKTSALTPDGYTTGQLVPSVSKVTVVGPATTVEQIEKVYFDAKISEKKLPLKASRTLSAQVLYDLKKADNAKYLTCEGIDDENTTVTIPVYKLSTVKTAVEFSNQPAAFSENPPPVSITPAEVQITHNPDETYDAFILGKVDFQTLSNTVNALTFTKDDLDEKQNSLLRSFSDEEKVFDVNIDLSAYEQRELDATNSNVVFVGQSNRAEKYEANLSGLGLDKVVVIGPAKSLEQLTPEDLQIEINVSNQNLGTSYRRVEISRISIQSDTIKDCWVYIGKNGYRANVRISE